MDEYAVYENDVFVINEIAHDPFEALDLAEEDLGRVLDRQSYAVNVDDDTDYEYKNN